MTPPAVAWPARPLANSTDGRVSTRTPRSTASLAITQSPPNASKLSRQQGDQRGLHRTRDPAIPVLVGTTSREHHVADAACTPWAACDRVDDCER